jgi:polysaccharide biosynthesis/export protein
MEDMPVKKSRHFGLALVSAASLTLAVACSASAPPPPTASSEPVRVAPSRVAANTDVAVKTSSTEVQNDSNDLEALWTSRMAAQPSNAVSRFALGPGDMVRISVPQIPQLRDRTVRVSEESTIALPLVGEINVSGMSEEDLRNELTHRVSKDMYHPQVEVFLEHTENRQVAVIGAVKVPGRYTLASRSDTIMTMISRAGGLADESSTRIILIPAIEAKAQGTAPQRAGLAPSPDMRMAEAEQARMSPVSMASSADPPDSLALRMMEHRVIIDTLAANEQRYLELPAMPGDVIIVPAAGEVTVQGWVDKPGSFKITPGMTTMGAIAAAGGANFSGSATLLREGEDGRKVQIPLDLSKLKSGEQPDVQVQSGDVVVVERSALGAVPYSLYFLAEHIGMGLGFSGF